MPRERWQNLCCLMCGLHLGRYEPYSASTIREQLYCRICKGHTEYKAEEGVLVPIRFLDKNERVAPALETSAPA